MSGYMVEVTFVNGREYGSDGHEVDVKLGLEWMLEEDRFTAGL